MQSIPKLEEFYLASIGHQQLWLRGVHIVQPINCSDSLGDLLRVEHIKVFLVGLELREIVKIFDAFGAGCLFKDNDSASSIAN